MEIELEFELEEDGRWLAEAPDLPGVLVYGDNRHQAAQRAKALALRVLADRLENGESGVDINPISFVETRLGQVAVS